MVALLGMIHYLIAFSVAHTIHVQMSAGPNPKLIFLHTSYVGIYYQVRKAIINY